MTLPREAKIKARKEHKCDGFDQIEKMMGRDELRDLSEGKYDLQSHSIKKGEVYVCQVYVDCGSVHNFRACQTCYDALDEYELYDE